MADPVRATGPESARGKKLIGFGKLFGLQDIYEGDEVRLRVGADRAGSSSSVEVTEKVWQDQTEERVEEDRTLWRSEAYS